MVTEEKRSLQIGAVLNHSITYAWSTFPGYRSSLLPSLTVVPTSFHTPPLWSQSPSKQGPCFASLKYSEWCFFRERMHQIGFCFVLSYSRSNCRQGVQSPCKHCLKFTHEPDLWGQILLDVENDLAASPYSFPEIYPESKGCKIYDKQLEIVENKPVYPV